MPRHPTPAFAAAQLRPSVFTSLAAQFAQLERPPIPLHLGDTYLQPPPAARLDRAMERMPKNAYGYTNPNGLEELRSAVAEDLDRSGLPGLQARNVHVTGGATGAIDSVLMTWLQPGDEILVLAPYWPLVKGMALLLGATPVEVPFYPAVRRGDDLEALLRRYLTPRTVAVYLTSPNNPCGTVLSRDQTEAVARFCVDHDLWAIDDAAYHHFTYAPWSHTFLATCDGMAARTATVLTASKSYALAGSRIGFLCGDTSWLDVARRVSTHTVYHMPMISQVSVLGAVTQGQAWVEETRQTYAAAADLVHRKLQARFDPAQGGGYVFVDLADELQGRPVLDYIGELLREGVCISPGDAFGADFATYARVCFTSAPYDQIELAIERINRSLEGLRLRRAG